LAALRLAVFLAAFFVAFFAGGTGTTFLRELSGRGSSNFASLGTQGERRPAAYLASCFAREL
jgi:hypothetical protein